MTFHSYSFIFLFMPVMLTGWYLLRGRGRLLWLIGMSMLFYGLFSWRHLVLLCADAMAVYALGAILDRCGQERRGIRRVILTAGVLLQLGLLFSYKYSVFAAENINSLLGTALPVREVLLPIGISFYAFSLISFLADRYSGELEQPELSGYLCFVLYFPKLLQGPIMRCGPFLAELGRVSRPDSARMLRGLLLFTIGLSKKVLLADALGRVTDVGFLHTYYLDSLTAVMVLLSYTFQLYFDFSGYCDMAEGVSILLGMELPPNFRSPYRSASVRELWQRWHMTLSAFFIRYVYIPLGGSRRGRARTLVNVLIVFVLSGIWHGAGWTYLCWGLMQGLLVIWDDLGIIGVDDDRDRPPRVVIPRRAGIAWSFTMFVISLIFFRSADMTYALQFFRQLFKPAWPGYLFIIAREMELPETYVLLQAARLLAPGLEDVIRLVTWLVLLIVSFYIVMTRPSAFDIANSLCGEETPARRTITLYGLILAWSILSLGSVSSFMYFQY